MDSPQDINVSKRFHGWYERFQSNFLYIGSEYGYQPEETWDFINQFFLDLLEKKIDPESIQNPQAYLSVAFRRKLIDHYRMDHKERLVPLKPGNEPLSELSVQDTLEQLESNTALISRIRAAYEKLPERCKRVIDLKFYGGMTTEQIALQTGLSKRSVYNNLFEGIKLLREEIRHTFPKTKIVTLLSALPLIFA